MATDDGSKAIGGQIARQIALLESGLAPGAQQWIENEWKPLAKQTAPVKTGEFRDSIDGTAGAGGMTLFATAPHAQIVENGDSTHRAQPTLKPAYHSTVQRLGKYLAQLIERAKQ